MLYLCGNRRVPGDRCSLVWQRGSRVWQQTAQELVLRGSCWLEPDHSWLARLFSNFIFSSSLKVCARGDGERMSRLMGLVGEEGTVVVRMRRSGAGERGSGLLDSRSCLGGRAGALGRGLEGAVWSIRSPFSSLEETYVMFSS